MITYTWTIEPADCIVSQNGLDNIVQTVYWKYKGEDENGIVYEPSGEQIMPPPTSEAFLPFNQINKQIVVGWLESILDMQSMQDIIATRIYEIKNPILVRLEIPN